MKVILSYFTIMINFTQGRYLQYGHMKYIYMSLQLKLIVSSKYIFQYVLLYIHINICVTLDIKNIVIMFLLLTCKV